MIVCICKAVSDREIKRLVNLGHTLKEIQEITSAATQCGSCFKCLKQVVEDTQKENVIINS